jgi:hypothetical protein
MAWMGIADTVKAINAQTVLHSVTKASDWIDCTSGFSFTIWALLSSAAGSPNFSFYVEVSPFSAQYLNDLVASGTDTAAYYLQASALATGVTTENTILRYTSTALDTPFLSLRVKATAAAGSNDDSVVSMFVTKFN